MIRYQLPSTQNSGPYRTDHKDCCPHFKFLQVVAIWLWPDVLFLVFWSYHHDTQTCIQSRGGPRPSIPPSPRHTADNAERILNITISQLLQLQSKTSNDEYLAGIKYNNILNTILSAETINFINQDLLTFNQSTNRLRLRSLLFDSWTGQLILYNILIQVL